MSGTRLAKHALGALVALIALAAATGSARAAVTASSISSPSANSYFFYDTTAASRPLFTVVGTTTGSGNVDIDCDSANGNVAALASNVTVTGNSFATPISTDEIVNAFTHGTCVLRAVDTGDATAYPPGSGTPFAGPTIAVSAGTPHAVASGTYDFDFFLNDVSGYMDLESPGGCGLTYGRLFAPGTLAESGGSFECLGAIYDTYTDESGAEIGPELEVDGQRTLDAASADPTVSGWQGITLTESFTGGSLTVHDDEPLMFCTPNCSSATSYTAAGVELDRTWQTADDGLVAYQTDTFVSTDGHQHALAVLEDEDINRASGTLKAAIDFPGSSGFQDYSDTATVTLPSGPGAIYFKADGATPAAGDGEYPQGAIVYSSTTSGPLQFTYSDEASTSNSPEWTMPYARTVPAGGSTTLRFAYAQAYSLTQVQSLAQTALSSFAPTVAIGSPTNGTRLTSSPATVTGSVSDPVGIGSLTVNGTVASVSATGTFSASVPLTPGANTLTASATDTDGNVGQTAVSVTYAPTPAATTGAASHVTASGAQLAGTVNPEGQVTSYSFQYGTSTAYGHQSTAGSAGAGASAVAATATLSGLSARTTYHYRIIATNATGSTAGADGTFTTGRPTPTSLGAKVSPKHARTSPYRYRVHGRLGRPHGVGAKQGCSGTVTVTVRHGRKTVHTGHAKVTKACTWKTTLKVKVGGQGKLTITPSFGGNKALARLSGKPLHVRYG